MTVCQSPATGEKNKGQNRNNKESKKTCVLSYFSCVQFFATCGLTVARQTPLSEGLSRQEYWSGLPFPPPGDLPDPGIEPYLSSPPRSLTSPALAGGFFTTDTIWEAHRESKKTRVLAFTWKGCRRVAGGEHTPHPSADCVLQGGLVCPVLSPPPFPSLSPVWGPWLWTLMYILHVYQGSRRFKVPQN